MRVLCTLTSHVPYGSLFLRFFWLYFEYTFTCDVRSDEGGRPSRSSQRRSISRRRSRWSANRLQRIVIASEGTPNSVRRKSTKHTSKSTSELTSLTRLRALEPSAQYNMQPP